MALDVWIIYRSCASACGNALLFFPLLAGAAARSEPTDQNLKALSDETGNHRTD
jgi:hypothetical protein